MVIHRSYYPDELWRDMQVTPVRHAVFVQVFNNEALEETSKYIVICLLTFSVLFKYVMKWYAVGTTLVMLNKLRCQAYFSFPTNQFTWSGLLIQFKYWMANSVDPDQLASSEANWSGSTLFAKIGYIQVLQDRIKKYFSDSMLRHF